MKSIKLRIVLILLMLIQVPFSCMDRDICLDLEHMPYYKMMDLVFQNVELYFINPVSEKPQPIPVSQEYDTFIYPCDSLMLFFRVPDTALLYHANHKLIRNGFEITQTAYACERPGYLGTLDKVDKIFISSRYDYDELHLAGYDLSDIVDIFVYSENEEEGGFWRLSDYNEQSPHAAPKRFFLLFTRKARLSEIQKFDITYHLLAREDEEPREFRIETPTLRVKLGR